MASMSAQAGDQTLLVCGCVVVVIWMMMMMGCTSMLMMSQDRGIPKSGCMACVTFQEAAVEASPS